MRKKFIVTLTEEERVYLEGIVKTGKGPAYKIKHAHILLNADKEGPDKSDREIAGMFRCHMNTASNVRRRFVEQGLESALERRKRETPPNPKKIDGGKEARLIALACSQPPEGYARWTLRMLADKMVEMEITDSVSPSTVCRTLKKTNSVPIFADNG